MKKTGRFLVISFLFILMLSSFASAETDSFMLVSASTSDRVHLRAAPDAGSASMGLYFSGTPLINLEDRNGNWLKVMIGSEKGYIRSDLVQSFDTFANEDIQWKKGTVNANGNVNLRAAPDKKAAVLKSVKPKESIAILGETADHWYYVKSGNLYGYMMGQYVKISKEKWNDTASAPLPDFIPGTYWFASGAGGWMVQMVIAEDGRFWGYFHDSDMGDTSLNYRLGTEHESFFTGYFSNVQKTVTYEYSMKVSSLQAFGIKGEKIQNEIRTITTSPYGLTNNAVIRIFLPGTPLHLLPEMGRSHFDSENQRITTTGLYCSEHEALWVQYPQK